MLRLRRRDGIVLLAAWLLLLSSREARSAPQDELPRIVPLRVPADQVPQWFPDREELTGMKVEAFDRIVENARKAIAERRTDANDTPRLLKSKHVAVWNQGLLEGKSSFVIDAPRLGPRRVLLDPWSCAVDEETPNGARIVADDAGGMFLLVEIASRNNTSSEISWKQQSRPGSNGRRFSMALPRTPVREFQIELPKSLKPERSSSLIRGPFSSPKADHWIWLYDGTSENLVLNLIDSGDGEGLDTSFRFWAERSTTLDLKDAAGTLRSDWTLPEKATRPSTLRFRVSQGVEIVGVSGPRLIDFKLTNDPQLGAFLTIRLEEAATEKASIDATSFSINALVSVPEEGNWSVPTIQPLNGVLTKGTTVVKVGATREVAAVRPENGRRVERKPAPAAEPLEFLFEDEGTDSVASFAFQRGKADVAVEIRGELFVGNSIPKFEAFLSWSFLRGRRFNLDIDLPRAWVADRVELVGVDDPIAWHPETRPGGELRLHVALPAGNWNGIQPILKISATANVSGGRGGMTLPQIRPVDARIIDETWITNLEEGYRIVPSTAKGLAWIDPASWVPFSSVARPSPAQKKPTDAASSTKPAALAWRWLTRDGEARVDRERVEESLRAAASSLVTLTRDTIEMRARVSVQSRAEGARSITIGLNTNTVDLKNWRITDAANGVELPRETVGPKARAAAKIAGEGLTWKVSLPASSTDRRVINIEHVQPRTGDDVLPLIELPKTISSPSLALVRTSRGVRANALTKGARDLDAEVVSEKLATDFTSISEDAARFRSVKAFEYDSEPPAVQLVSESLARVGSLGLIEQLRVSSTVDPTGPEHHRFALDIVPGDARTLEVEVPSGVELIGLRRDGIENVPRIEGSTYIISIAPSKSKPNPMISVVLNFQTANVSRGSAWQVVLPRLRFSLPCLSTSWRVSVREDWGLKEWSRSLTNSDPIALPRDDPWALLNDVQKALGRRKPPTSATKTSIAARLSELEASLGSLPAGEFDLASLLKRWNRGTPAILIDRGAIEELGVFPETKLRVEGSPSDRAKAFLRNLRALELAIYQVGDTLLVTSTNAVSDLDRARSENPNEQALWRKWFSAVLKSGSDLSDRFETVGRWAEDGSRWFEANPDRREPREASRALLGSNPRRSYRFNAIGWPEDDLRIRFEDGTFQRASLLGGVPVVLLLMFASWKWVSPRFRRSWILMVLLIAWNAFWLLSGVPRVFPAIMFLLTAPAIMVEIRQAWKQRGKRARWSFVLGTPQTVSPTTVTLGATAGLIFLGATAPLTLARIAGSEPIVVLYPYEGSADPTAKPSRVVMRLADFDRLEKLASPERATLASPTDARSMVHRLRQINIEEIEVATTLELLVADQRPAPWKFPIGESRKISASANGQPIPVTIEPGGKTGEIRLDSATLPSRKAGELVSCVITRSLRTRTGESGKMISLPVNPHPKARVEWSSEDREWNPTITRGTVTESPTKSSRSTLIGPSPILEVRWDRPGAVVAPPPGSSADAVYLWDKTSAGDRLRARLMIKNPGGTSRLRLELSEGLLVRDFNIPGEVDTTLETTPKTSIWEARIEPPLPEETAIEIDLWRPNSSRTGLSDAGHDRVCPAPAVDILGMEKITATLGFRRPPDWDGRLVAEGDDEPVTEESFARTWGSLPDEALTLSGALKPAVKENKILWPKVRCQPDSPRLKVQPSLRLIARRGKVDFNLAADLVDPLGTSHEIQLDFPAAFQIVQVSLEGLTSWTPVGDRTLRIRFDGPGQTKRRLTIVGWIAVESEASSGSESFSQSVIPWPKWPGQAVESGSLVVVATSRFELVNSPGAVVVSSDQEGLGTVMGTPNRMTFRVEDESRLGSIRWESDPPKVSVRVLGELTMNPDTASWVSRLRYDVAGGPLEWIHLKLPTRWAKTATVQLVGMTHQKVSEARGESTFWTIRPEKPVWGSVQVIVRASLPLLPNETQAFPEIGPLGRGEVDSYLKLTNATLSPLIIEGTSGLKPVAPISFDPGDESIGDSANSTRTTYYHVTKPGWSLRARRSGQNTSPGASLTDHAEIDLVVGSEGEIVGRGVFRINTYRDAFLSMALPSGAEILAAIVNGKEVPTFASEGALRLIPTDGGLDQIVTVLWRSKAQAMEGKHGRRLGFPVVRGRAIPAVIRINAPERSTLIDTSRNLGTASSDQNDLEIASWTQREIQRSLDAIDRGSRSDTQRLVDEIIHFESRINEIKQRSSDSSIIGRAERLQKELTQALVIFSLEEFQNAARASLDLMAASEALRSEPARRARSLLRLPRVGIPLEFSGQLPSEPSSIAMLWSIDPASRPSSPAVPYFLLGLSSPLVLGLFWISEKFWPKSA